MPGLAGPRKCTPGGGGSAEGKFEADGGGAGKLTGPDAAAGKGADPAFAALEGGGGGIAAPNPPGGGGKLEVSGGALAPGGGGRFETSEGGGMAALAVADDIVLKRLRLLVSLAGPGRAFFSFFSFSFSFVKSSERIELGRIVLVLCPDGSAAAGVASDGGGSSASWL